MNVETWYDAVADLDLDDDVQAPWAMVPLITEALMEDEQAVLLFLAEAEAGTDQQRAEGIAEVNRAMSDKNVTAMVNGMARALSGVRNNLHTIIARWVTQNRDDLWEEALNYRAELAEGAADDYATNELMARDRLEGAA